jgi:Flp pilus assembly CpaE family ATPase
VSAAPRSRRTSRSPWLAVRKKPVAIIDLDLQFGDVGVALDLRGANSIVDLVEHVDSIDATLIDEIFVRHESGIRALVAPDNIAAVDSVDAGRVVEALDLLREHFGYVVCDLGRISTISRFPCSALRTGSRWSRHPSYRH